MSDLERAGFGLPPKACPSCGHLDNSGPPCADAWHISRRPDFDPHELYPAGGRVEAVTDATGESNVTVIRDAGLAHVLRIAARDSYAEKLALAGLAMLPEAEAQWYGRRD